MIYNIVYNKKIFKTMEQTSKHLYALYLFTYILYISLFRDAIWHAPWMDHFQFYTLCTQAPNENEKSNG